MKANIPSSMLLLALVLVLVPSLPAAASLPGGVDDDLTGGGAATTQTRPPIASQTQTSPVPEEEYIQFERLSTAGGLSFPVVRDILQDQQGFMWFATDSGLNRYDGYEFKVYTRIPGDPTSLPFPGVAAIYEDRDGTLWVATGGGLSRFDRTTETFTHPYRQGQVYCIHQDSAGTLWIGTWRGLFGLDPSSGTITHTYQQKPGSPDDPSTISHNAVYNIHEDQQGDLWISTFAALDRLDRNSGIFTHYQPDPGPQGSTGGGFGAATVLEDRQGVLWIGESRGLHRVELPSEAEIHYQHDPADPYSLSSNQVTALLEDSAGRLWVGSMNGLNALLPPSGSRQTGAPAHFVHFRHNPDDPHSLSDDIVAALYEDRSGVLWVGTANGISKYNRRSDRFTHYPNPLELSGEASQAPELRNHTIIALYEDRGGALWIATLEGLVRLDRQSGSTRLYQHDPTDPGSLSSSLVPAIFQDHEGVVWLGTSNGWLERYEPQTESFAHHRKLTGSNITQISEDPDGNLWISTTGGATGGGGVYSLDADREVLSHYTTHPDNPDSHNVKTIYADREGVIWVGGLVVGVSLLDYDQPGVWGTEFKHYQNEPGNPQSLGSDYVLSIYEDPSLGEGIVWVGTQLGGLNRFDRATQTFKRYTQEDGLADNTVGCMLADADGFLWLSTPKGISRFDPRTESFQNYDARDGVFSLLHFESPQLCLRSQSGEMIFGGINGLVVFYPERIEINQNSPPVAITALKVFNQTVRTSFAPDEQIRLSHQDNFVSFEFSALDYTIPEKNQYAFMMEGLDKDWVYVGTRRFADYPNLQPGDYVFRVKATNSDGVWNEAGAALQLIIEPPIWETWPYRVMLAVAILGGMLGVYRQRVKNVEASRRELATQVEQRTAELQEEIEQRLRIEEALRQSEMEKAVVAERSRLARELHDAVTQTLFSASLIAEVLPRLWQRDPEEGRRRLEELRELTRGALAEMRTLLLELRPASLVEANLSELLRQLAESVTGRARVPVVVQVEGEGSVPSEVKVALYRIVQEALNNIAKHAQASQASVSLRYEDRAVSLTISDDGRGFDPQDIPADSLGLGIMQERARTIGARLLIESQPGSGTQVRVLWREEDAQLTQGTEAEAENEHR